ncbi:MAG: hypothetical protein IT374_17685 [Polyangiaceae bacterium]|nr:hypothetical protein [Polyangiaceae bacterium]
MKRLPSIVVAALALSLSHPAAAGPPPSKASRAEFQKAQGLFDKAKALLEKGKVEEALAGFHKSYDVVASPISRLFVARCLAALGRELDAHRELTEVTFDARAEAAKDVKYDETRQAAEAERAELAPKVAIVDVRLQDAALTGEVTIGGTARPRDRLTAGWAVPPGVVEVALSTPRGRDARSVTVALGERREVVFGGAAAAVAPPPAPVADDGASTRKKLRVGGWVAGAVGAVGLGVFALEGSRARSRYDQLKDDCAGGPCPTDRASDVSAGRRDARIANIGLAVGAIGVGAGVTLLVLGREPKAGHAGSPRVTVAGGLGGVSVQGRFQ